MGIKRLVEINLFSKEGSDSSGPSQIRSRCKKSRLTKSHHHRLRLGSDAGIESIGMSPQLVRKFQKGIAISYDMIIQEINKNVKLKIDILELKREEG